MSLFFVTDDAPQGDLGQLIGAKAANLWVLGRAGLPVPEWVAVTRDGFLSAQPSDGAELALPDDLEASLDVALIRLGATPESRWAVRSSAIGEDGAEASFAGQLDSFLNVPPADVPAHVLRVWRSALKASVAAYQSTRGQTQRLIPAVLIQRMVPAQAAGVAFGCDPVSGDTSVCIVSAVAGLADKLVGGEENGVLYRVHRDGRIEGDDPLLSPDDLRAIESVLRRSEAHFQKTQDMEWALSVDGIKVLQSRPVTTQPLATKTEGAEIVWDNSNIVESYSGVTSALTFSFARYVYAHVYVEFCKIMGVPADRVRDNADRFRNMLGRIRGHVYYNLVNWYRLLSLFPGFALNRGFMEQMMGVRTPLPAHIVDEVAGRPPGLLRRVADGFALARTLAGLIWHQIRLPATMRAFHARLDAAMAEAVPEGARLDQLAAAYRGLERRLLARWDAPLINDFLCMIAFGASRKALEKMAGARGLEYHADVMIGQGDIISAEPARRMREMARLIRDDAYAIEAFTGAWHDAILRVRERSPLLDQRLRDYMTMFSDRCLQELKLESPTLRDDPSSLYRAIGHMAAQMTGATPVAAEIRILPDVKAVVGPGWLGLKAWWAGVLLKWARAGVRQRENLRFERTRVFGRVRRIFVEIGQRLTAQGRIDTPADIFHLEVEEVLGFVEGTATLSDLRGLVALRKAEDTEYQARVPPPSRFTSYGAVASFMAGTITPDEAPAAMPEGDTLKGLGCCRGRVRAPVRVINDPHGAVLEPGEIMVARFTDPGWITLFVNASGILVERGSLLSHSAIVAREMNIPAIVAIDGVMEWLKTGDVVEMDGATGQVTKVSDV